MGDGKQFWALLFIGFLAFAEFSSWVTASWPGACVVSPEQDSNAADQANQHNCPTFFVGSWIVLKRVDRVVGRHDKSIVAIFTVVLAISTIGLWVSTNALWKAGERQLEHAQSVAVANSANVSASITEAARTASAMEVVANAIIDNGQRQLRAYLAVLPGDSIWQTDALKFEFHPIIRNNGFTPATDVVVISKTIFHAHPLPEVFDFSLSVIGEPSIGTIGSQQSNFAITFLDRMLTPEEIDELKIPDGRRLTVYGEVSYKDIFSRGWKTNFCFWVAWGEKDIRPSWMTTRRHNDAT
jgi:hypothetical protein